MEKIEPGKYFEFTYNLYRVDPDGTEVLMHEVDPGQPERAVFGVTQGFIKALERELEGLRAGDTYNFTATPDEAFGPYDKDDIAHLSRDIFMVDGKFDEEAFVPGAYVPMMTSDGYRIDGLILEVKPDEVVVDFNHPLAKDNVRFEGKILTVRDATPEEIHPAGGCGCGGGCCGGDSGCSDSSCGGGGCCH